jgi:sugar-specific transcriptional regulator TrmB/AmiR/NasT family two-component response regulator
MTDLESEFNQKNFEINTATSSKIIIIDDDAGLGAVLEDILSQEGYQTTIVQTGEAAIKKCQMQTFDVALVDIKLPDMEGTELLELLKKITPTTLLIVMTGYPSLDNAVRSLNLGVENYIVKPFKSQKLLEQIKTQLERRQFTRWETLLRNTGLSIYEAKIYLSLNLSGSSEVRRLSMTSGVPRTKVYDALKKLKQRGLIYDVPGATQRFSVANPEGAFSTFVQNWRKELSERQSLLTEFESAIAVMDSIHTKQLDSLQIDLQKEDVWYIRSEQEIKQRISDILSKVKTSVCILTTEEGLVFLNKNFAKALYILAENGAKILIKVPIGLSNRSFVKDLRVNYKVEHVSLSNPIFLMKADKAELFFHCLKMGMNENVEGKVVGLFCKSEILCSFFSNIFFRN